MQGGRQGIGEKGSRGKEIRTKTRRQRRKESRREVERKGSASPNRGMEREEERQGRSTWGGRKMRG